MGVGSGAVTSRQAVWRDTLCASVAQSWGWRARAATCGVIASALAACANLGGLTGGSHAGLDASTAEVGADAVLGDASAEAGCDPTQQPRDEPCVVANSYGIFVGGTSATDTNAGTMDAPVATIGKGLQLAAAARKNVYVCDGTYGELVTVPDGARLFGGFGCPGEDAGAWAYTGVRPVVAPAVPGEPLQVTGLITGATVADIEFDAAPGASPGAPSIAAFVASSSNVNLLRVVLVAADGANGVAGALGAGFSSPSMVGGAASGTVPGIGPTCHCANGQTAGGNGGAPGAVGSNGIPGLGGSSPQDGAGGQPSGGSCDGGDQGAPSPDAEGAPALTTLGSITPSGWVPSVGAAGATAGAAQGGGGGAGDQNASGAGGGGGGCGGCGGGGGGGAGSGGSSLALVSFESVVTLDACTLRTGKGGIGGAGGAGQPGQAGGSGGLGGSTPVDSCAGGPGGTGGSGGGGGGGAGGSSIGVAYTGPLPSQVGGTIGMPGTPGPAGAAGRGGGPGNSGSKGLPGAPGPVKMF
jgi:hypothetical protein